MHFNSLDKYNDENLTAKEFVNGLREETSMKRSPCCKFVKVFYGGRVPPEVTSMLKRR